MVHTKIISVLHRIIADDKPMGKNFIKSGNLLNKLHTMGEDNAIQVADAYYLKTAKEKEVVERGYLLGRLNKKRLPVYRIELEKYVFFFVGNEADILRKFEESGFLESVEEPSHPV